MTLFANWSYPTSIRFGAGRIDEIESACHEAGCVRPLLVTDRGLASLPITARMLDLMQAAGLGRGIFSAVDPNPNEKNLADGLTAFLEGGYDGVIAFGGGSGLDLGKMVAFMSGQSRPLWHFEKRCDRWKRANPLGIAPIIAVPTTAGTGSEVGRASLITNSETHEKKIIFHPRMMPTVVIADPELTFGMPPAITAGTGMDAFSHCLEAFCSPYFHPMSHGVALEGMRIVREFLPLAYVDGTNIEARSQMMAAATMGAVAFQKGLGAIHALSHTLGAVYNTHHGTTNAVILPQVLRFNRPAIEERIEKAALYLGIAGGFDAFLDDVLQMRAALGIPENLMALGIHPDRINSLAISALNDPTSEGNPVKMTLENTRALLESCY
jgi:alcohol dehydrogenase class IV